MVYILSNHSFPFLEQVVCKHFHFLFINISLFIENKFRGEKAARVADWESVSIRSPQLVSFPEINWLPLLFPCSRVCWKSIIYNKNEIRILSDHTIQIMPPYHSPFTRPYFSSKHLWTVIYICLPPPARLKVPWDKGLYLIHCYPLKCLEQYLSDSKHSVYIVKWFNEWMCTYWSLY